MKYQLFLLALSMFTFRMCRQALGKFDIHVSACDWFRINNKRGFLLANGFGQREFFKFF